MIDWCSSMQQTYEFYKVDPITWEDNEKISTIQSCTINRDSSNSTLGSSTIDTTEMMDECYIRIYLVATQNQKTKENKYYDEVQKVPLGTFLFQTPAVEFDGKSNKISMDGYTPLIELKEKPLPIGYSLLKDDKIMNTASRLCRENVRAPVIQVDNEDVLHTDFVAELDDTWLTFLTDLITVAKHEFSLDEYGQIMFDPVCDIASLSPVWTYDDGNSSILLPDVQDERDIYGIPNVVEVTYYDEEQKKQYIARVVNEDEDSPISTVNRGREIVYRESNPEVSGSIDQQYIEDYATQLLRNMSCLEHTVTYTHGYCPVRLGDCVRLNYERAGLINVKAKVISQSIKCETGCTVEETAVYTTKLWR